LTLLFSAPKIKIPVLLPRLLPPRSTAGQLTLDQHIGVRIPGGQPKFLQYLRGFPALTESPRFVLQICVANVSPTGTLPVLAWRSAAEISRIYGHFSGIMASLYCSDCPRYRIKRGGYVGEPSNPAASVLDGYIRQVDLARQLSMSVRTLQRLAARRLGPPRTKVGRLIVYNIEHVRDWLSQQEQPRKPVASVRSQSRWQLRQG
jgi:hypothetical protein